LDTEFTDFLDLELISIGLVAEDGCQFYAEVADFDRGKCSQFVRAAVLGQLGQGKGASVSRSGLPARLRAWFADLPGQVTVASENFVDWELLVDALDGEMPPQIVGRLNLQELASNPDYQSAVAKYHGPGRAWHHALHDAMALRAGWMAANPAGCKLPPQPEDRSLALHRRVAEKLRADPALLRLAVANLDRWRDADAEEFPDRQEWRRLLKGRLEDLLAVLVDPGERGARLRKASPFPGVLTEDERQSVIKAWKAGRTDAT